MASVAVEGDELVVRLSARERVGALRSEVRVPVTSVREVHTVTVASKGLRGFRAPGTGLPGVVALGTWRRRGGKDFVAAYRRHPGIVIELEGQEFDRLIVSGPAPDDVMQLGRR